MRHRRGAVGRAGRRGAEILPAFLLLLPHHLATLRPPAPCRLPAACPAQVSVPGATDKGAMKLIDVLGRLLLLALRKAGGGGGSPARFCVAAGAVASLAQSCLASQTVGSTRHGTTPDVDRVLGVLSAELGGQVEASLPAAERCAVIEALLYLQVRLCVCVYAYRVEGGCEG